MCSKVYKFRTCPKAPFSSALDVVDTQLKINENKCKFRNKILTLFVQCSAHVERNS